jgi:hypothetical protein
MQNERPERFMEPIRPMSLEPNRAAFRQFPRVNVVALPDRVRILAKETTLYI